jgi:hypothetical protein
MLSAHVTTADPARPRPKRRVAGLLAGLVLVGGSIGLIAAGAFAVLASAGTTYVGLGAHGTYESGRYGLTTAGTDWRTQLLGWADGVRIEAASEDDRPIFLGVARPGDLTRRLSGTAYTTFAEHIGRGVTGIDPTGSARVLAAASRVHWTARAQGVGTQTVRWKATEGPHAVFAMHADGSRPVRVRVVSSAVTLGRMPWWVPAATLASGVVLLATAVVVLRRAIRIRRSTRQEIR